MIRVTFRAPTPQYINDPLGVPSEPRDINADDVNLYEGWAVFQKYVDVPGEKYRDTAFVEAIRMEKIDSLKRVDP